MILNPLEQFKIYALIPIKVLDYDISITNSSIYMILVMFIIFYVSLILKHSSKQRNKKLGCNINELFLQLNDTKISVDTEQLYNEYSSLNDKINDQNHNLYHLYGKSNHYDPSLHILHKDTDKDIDFTENITEEIVEKLIPTKFEIIFEAIYQMISKIVISTAGSKADGFIPFIMTLYLFILLCNLIGMIPGSFTVTSHINVTFCLAIIVFLSCTIVGFKRRGFRYLAIFVPSGTPIFIAPLMFIIELFTYCARPISLSLRITANMTAGHIVLKVIASLSSLIGLFGIFPMFILVVLNGFEIFVGILQAYIFCILTCVYLSDALNDH